MRKRIHRGISRRFVLVSRTAEQLSYLATSAAGGLPTACEFYSRKYVNPITGSGWRLLFARLGVVRSGSAEERLSCTRASLRRGVRLAAWC